jgi:hypothetical protein
VRKIVYEERNRKSFFDVGKILMMGPNVIEKLILLFFWVGKGELFVVSVTHTCDGGKSNLS